MTTPPRVGLIRSINWTVVVDPKVFEFKQMGGHHLSSAGRGS